ncbi:hypothetical protein CIPAW_09G168600 [Carya illinoinensis]|uniref:Uncharacterized protein n=1 Tax=Carya illinoinensis TaxID=32201 RepID=A0A8T1PF12_CARIL|nr:hypothetical protein CIPAW_09G168600 [Carya illinoinensis]
MLSLCVGSVQLGRLKNLQGLSCNMRDFLHGNLSSSS